jgi:hypothetical protein
MILPDKIDDWNWIDALQIAMPVFVHLGSIYNDSRYFDRMHEMYLIFTGRDSSSLLMFTTTIPTGYRMPTLMHDPVYKMGVAWQNIVYNQPPHPGFFLPDEIVDTNE